MKILRNTIAETESAKKEKETEIERLKSENAVLQANAKKSPPSTQKERVKFHIEECLRNFNSAINALNALPKEEQEKPAAAIRSMVGKMEDLLK